jgi:HEAT repeat protein
VLALIVFAGGELAALGFGSPPERELTPEEHVREILANYAARRDELFDIAPAPAAKIVARILKESDGTAATVLTPIRALGFLGWPQVFEAVVPYVRHPDHAVRLAAIRSLGQLTKFDAIPLIEPFLDSTDREERREAIIALGKFGKSEEIPKIDHAASGDPELEKLAREAAERIKATVQALRTKRFDPVVDAVIDTAEFEDLAALIFVTKFRLLEIVEDRTRAAATRERAVRVLAIARVLRAGLPMRDILADRDNPLDLRLQAIYGVGVTRTKSAVPQLIELLDDADPRIRELSIVALGRIGDTRALEPLLARWAAADPDTRQQLRLAFYRLRSRTGFEPLLEPLRTYQPRAVENVYFISDSLDLSRGYDRAIIAPSLKSPANEERRDALLLLATFGTTADSWILQMYFENDADPLNREIANLGIERLKDIPIWDRA